MNDPLKKFVLFHANGRPQPKDIELIKTHTGIAIVDETDERAFLVEARLNAIKELKNKMPEWVIEEEKILPGPNNLTT